MRSILACFAAVKTWQPMLFFLLQQLLAFTVNGQGERMRCQGRKTSTAFGGAEWRTVLPLGHFSQEREWLSYSVCSNEALIRGNRSCWCADHVSTHCRASKSKPWLCKPLCPSVFREQTGTQDLLKIPEDWEVGKIQACAVLVCNASLPSYVPRIVYPQAIILPVGQNRMISNTLCKTKYRNKLR